jgi:flagellar hook-basal body complex protein FliE
MPIDPTMAVSGGEWQIEGLGALTDASGTGARAAEATGTGFGEMLSSSIESLTAAQTEAAGASQAFAAGTVTDPTEVVMAVERARLSMQLASQVRTKAVEAYQDIFHTQV